MIDYPKINRLIELRKRKRNFYNAVKQEMEELKEMEKDYKMWKAANYPEQTKLK